MRRDNEPRLPNPDPNTIVIKLEDGIVKVENLPAGMKIRVLDYDIEGFNLEDWKDNLYANWNNDVCLLTDFVNQDGCVVELRNQEYENIDK